jgi:hypothetical protein
VGQSGIEFVVAQWLLLFFSVSSCSPFFRGKQQRLVYTRAALSIVSCFVGSSKEGESAAPELLSINQSSTAQGFPGKRISSSSFQRKSPFFRAFASGIFSFNL